MREKMIQRLFGETGYFDPKKCPKCGKRFISAPYHVFKEDGKYYCSWTCFNHRKDKKTDVEVPQ